MVEPKRTLFEYQRPQIIGDEFSVQAVAVAADNFEIKANTIGRIQNLV